MQTKQDSLLKNAQGLPIGSLNDYVISGIYISSIRGPRNFALDPTYWTIGQKQPRASAACPYINTHR